ncbi:MAG: metallophosphoesterase family protein [Chloroflexi bacterium]|nr:metallophosphoesterase family protein [Chloroflexota bacterium]
MTKIAILSDSHDNIKGLATALQEVRASGADVLLHCGDFCAPFIVEQLAQGFTGPIHAIFGNNDGDGRMLQTIANKYAHFNLYGIYTEITVANRQVALIHYPEPARRIAQSGQLDLVCYGHDHKKYHEEIGRCHLVNPGEIMGKGGTISWGLYDCDAHRYEERLIEA